MIQANYPILTKNIRAAVFTPAALKVFLAGPRSLSDSYSESNLFLARLLTHWSPCSKMGRSQDLVGAF